MSLVLLVKELRARARGARREILKGVTLSLGKGEVVALMGPNGSGKSTLAHVLMGDPRYEVTSGSVLFLGEELMSLPPHERARKGLFLSFQHPAIVPGVALHAFLRTALNSRRSAKGGEPLRLAEFNALLKEKLRLLRMSESFANRSLNEGFSGGEKKRAEILQLALFSPTLAILDEPDSGLDVDALRLIAESLEAMRAGGRSFLLITHYQRIFHHLKPDRVYVMKEGRIVREGGPGLARELEEKGYEEF